MGKGYINLSKIYTRGGDLGDTSLFGGSRIKKNNVKVHSYGSIDEACAALGRVRSITEDSLMKNILLMVQNKLIVAGAHLASDTAGRAMLKSRIEDRDVKFLEEIIDGLNRKLLPLTEFVIPGSNPVEAELHVARTVVRRGERHLVELALREEVSGEVLRYINRLSDLLFVLGRLAGEKIPGKAPVKGEKSLALRGAKQIMETGEVKAAELGKDFVIAIVNGEGNLILQERMDRAILASVDIAYKKAYTAAALRMTTEEVANLIKPNESLYGLQNDPRYVVFGGGVPLWAQGEVIGAVGVSGGSVEEDMVIADACRKRYEELYIKGELIWR